jgi:hypothetical protein
MDTISELSVCGFLPQKSYLVPTTHLIWMNSKHHNPPRQMFHFPVPLPRPHTLNLQKKKCTIFSLTSPRSDPPKDNGRWQARRSLAATHARADGPRQLPLVVANGISDLRPESSPGPPSLGAPCRKLGTFGSSARGAVSGLTRRWGSGCPGSGGSRYPAAPPRHLVLSSFTTLTLSRC